jgi:hypothetical protein
VPDRPSHAQAKPGLGTGGGGGPPRSAFRSQVSAFSLFRHFCFSVVPTLDVGLTNQDLPRAVSTCEVVGTDRENVQIKRTRRYRNLRRDVFMGLRAWLRLR